MAIILMLPQQALCLRPMAQKNSDESLKSLPSETIISKRGRPSKHPGREKLTSLIQKHKANIVKIAEELDVTRQAISQWIVDDPKLKKLARRLRLIRKTERRVQAAILSAA